MSSLQLEETLEDVPINDFQGATLRIDPASGQPSRSVSPNSATTPIVPTSATDFDALTKTK